MAEDPRRRRLSVLVLAAGLLGTPHAPAAPPSDPGQEYAQKAERLGDRKNPKAWLALADFAEQNLLFEKREEALRKTVAQTPDHPEARRRLDEIKVGDAWLPADEAEAKEIEGKQAKGLAYYGDKWVPGKEAERLRAVDRKAEGWPLDFRMDTPRLRIFSSRSVAFTWKLAAILENEIDAYHRLYGAVWKLQAKLKPLKVYCFGDREDFSVQVGLLRDEPVPEWMSGYYAPWTQILYVCHSALDSPKTIERTATATAAHEMVHALDDRLARIYDRSRRCEWIFEGRAEYFGRAVVGRQVLPGACSTVYGDQPSDLDLGLSSIPPDKLLALDSDTLLKQDSLPRYAASWAWVHFLFHGEGGSHAERFRGYLKGFPAKDSFLNFEMAVGDVPGLEAAFKAHVQDVFLPALEAAAAAP